THVGAASFSYKAVMDGIRAGRVWVDHGGLISGPDSSASRPVAARAPLGGALRRPPRRPGRPGRPHQPRPTAPTGPKGSSPSLGPRRRHPGRCHSTGLRTRTPSPTPTTKVVGSLRGGQVHQRRPALARTPSARLELGDLGYIRLRGTDGNRHRRPGVGGAAVDPVGPAMDALGGRRRPVEGISFWFYSPTRCGSSPHEHVLTVRRPPRPRGGRRHDDPPARPTT
ncbi:hypothetical protein ACRAWF_09380, partial [Streptomyces sp. L7]